MYMRENHAVGACCHAICAGYFEKNKLRGRCPSDQMEDRRENCHHEMRNVEQTFDLCWCIEKHIGSEESNMRARGCVCCCGMFILEK